MTAGVEVRGLSVRYGAQTALGGVDLAVEAGEYAVLLGASGSGKTTLLNAIAGFVDPTEGRIAIGGRDVTRLAAQARPTTTVFQDYALFPHMDLTANVGFGLRMRGLPRRARDARAEAMLALVGLEGAGARRPHQLSGGQRQRVALARALAVEPDVLLLDEPLGALDLGLRRQMQEELKAIQRRVGTTFIHVTHDQEEAMALADRIVLLAGGRIEDDGPPERVYLAPRSAYAAEFMGEVNWLPRDAGGRTPFGPAPGAAAARVGIRPEHLRPAADGPVEAEIVETAFLGTHVRVRAKVAGWAQPLALHLPPGAARGQRVRIAADPGRLIVVGADG